MAGYLAVWAAFAAAMTALQAMLTQMQLLTPALQIKGPLISGAIFLAAGLYQFSQLKKACLAQCQSPIRFLTKRRRHGNRGAWRMGLEHGAICLGCCGGLMLLLFAGGVLNFFWIAGLAVFVSVEKLLPGGRRFGRYVAILLCGIGLGWIIFPDF